MKSKSPVFFAMLIAATLTACGGGGGNSQGSAGASPPPVLNANVVNPAPVATGTGDPATSLSWQGYQWAVRTAPGAPGAPQQWSAGNVFIDANDWLHLKITRDATGNYQQAELDSIRIGWGYGTYTWRVNTDVSQFAPEYVLGLFTYGADAAYGHREIDIEASAWGSAPVTWDYTTWANGHNPVSRNPAPVGASTQQIDWQADHITWTSWDAAGRVIATSTATGADVPVPGDEGIGINLWVCGCSSNWQQTTPATEVVLSGFQFVPAVH